ncbi:septum formation inhibitor [Nocardiopsis gilva YIM 90087]|uniref:Septum formation inhibitor n=1 Tax=Nocardiopsis gilva YIM 90087 TaxID=1235441 RepID=A0A223S2X2_9ACTN|nr:septum formation initiator family protein [Nocardiopsis gilva]ASU82486.1 septum formation inhibitor [Nocardiopsis gilva YIM 90087]
MGTVAAGRIRPALTSRAAILGLVICVIALSLAYPLREYITQRAEIARLQEQRSRAQESVSELKKRKEQLQDPTYIEREARTRLHYQYPGERAYVVIPADRGEQTDDGDPAPAEPWFTKLWKSVKGADEGGSTEEQVPDADAPPD